MVKILSLSIFSIMPELISLTADFKAVKKGSTSYLFPLQTIKLSLESSYKAIIKALEKPAQPKVITIIERAFASNAMI